MKNINKKPTVTVFVSAYNEEKNIGNFLNSVLNQKQEKFFLKEIVVVSDGSTDKTVEMVKKINSKKVKVVADGIRIGKSSRLNKVYKTFKSDILVQSDADVVFAHDRVIEKIIKPIVHNPSVGLCGGNPIASKSRTFTESSINVTHSIYRRFRKTIRNGNNVFSADGRLLALSKNFARNLEIPSTMIANDMFAYFSCIAKGYEYRYVENAVVYYRSPQLLKDHIKQNIRFEAGPLRMKRYFNDVLVDKETHIPFLELYKGMILTFLRYPVHSIYIYVVNSYCRVLAKKKEKKMTAKWAMAKSTKTSI